MIKKTITFTNYFGETVTKDYYFNLTRTECAEIAAINDGLGVVSRISESKSLADLFSIIKTVILKSYGRKSDDGMRFEKSEQMMRDFEQSPAYDTMVQEFFDDPDKFGVFMNGVAPAPTEKDKERYDAFRKRIDSGMSVNEAIHTA